MAAVGRCEDAADHGDPKRAAGLAGEVVQRRPDTLLGVRERFGDPAGGEPLLALLRAAANDPAVSRLAAELVEREIVIPLAGSIGGEDALKRAAAFSAQMSGIIFSRYVLRIEPVASMAADEIVHALEPSLAHSLSGGPQPASRRAQRAAG